MGVRLLSDNPCYAISEKACFYCSTSMKAFGPVFTPFEEWSATEVAEAFQEYCEDEGVSDLRIISSVLEALYNKFLDKVRPDRKKMQKYVERALMR